MSSFPQLNPALNVVVADLTFNGTLFLTGDKEKEDENEGITSENVVFSSYVVVS